MGSAYSVRRARTNIKSKGEADLYSVLREVFPHYKIIPQYAIKTRFTTLFIDYYIPQARIAVEFDGRQHDEYVKHFHGDKQGFADSQYRDSEKEKWCASRGVRLLRFKHYEKVNKKEVTQKLLG